MIKLSRAYLPMGRATFGSIRVGGGEFACLERPWLGNQRKQSCIPEGVYRLRKRVSAVVTRSTGGEYSVGWEVTDVPGRDWIMIHPGNYTIDTDGCILPGRGFSWHGQHGPMVTHSRDAFRDLMAVLDEREEWDIDIRVNSVSFP